MATDKLFNVAGISKLNGEYKVRFANDIMRIKVLAKHGHEDIRLADLEKSVTKLEATAQATITEYLEDKTPKTAVKAAPVKATAKAKAPAKAAKVLEDEDAPF